MREKWLKHLLRISLHGPCMLYELTLACKHLDVSTGSSCSLVDLLRTDCVSGPIGIAFV